VIQVKHQTEVCRQRDCTQLLLNSAMIDSFLLSGWKDIVQIVWGEV